MSIGCHRLLLCVLALTTGEASAQATRVVADTQSYFLRRTQEWGRQSPLRGLVEASMGRDDAEVRLWQGYGLGGTSATVMRRIRGRWTVWSGRVVQCAYSIPGPVGDTLSAPSIRRYQALARRRCAEPDAGERDAPPGSSGWTVVMVDTLAVSRVRPAVAPSETWDVLVAAGLLTLPPSVPRPWVMVDGHTYVLEVRLGDEYHASVIEHTSPPATAADSTIQAIAATFRRLVPPRR